MNPIKVILDSQPYKINLQTTTSPIVHMFMMDSISIKVC